MAEYVQILVNYWVAIQNGGSGILNFLVSIYPMLVATYFVSLIAFLKSYKDELRKMSVALMKGTVKGLVKLINLFN